MNTFKLITTGIITAAALVASTAMAADYSLTTDMTNGTGISTMSVNGTCSDSGLMQGIETCPGSSVKGQTPAGKTRVCIVNTGAIIARCFFHACTINLYKQPSCAGKAIATATLNPMDFGTSTTPISGLDPSAATYTSTDPKTNYTGTLKILK